MPVKREVIGVEEERHCWGFRALIKMGEIAGDLRKKALLSWGFDGVGSRLKIVGFLGAIEGFEGFEGEANLNEIVAIGSFLFSAEMLSFRNF